MSKLTKRSFGNREQIEKSDNCCCYFCLNYFLASEVTEYCKELDGKETALCPHCSIDAVIAEDSEGKLPPIEELTAQHEESFCG